jgi:hypothetical protein
VTATSACRKDERDDRYDAICDDGNLTRRQLLIWAGNRLAPDVPVFTEGALLHLYGAVDAAAFARAYRAVITGADALRMVVEDVDGWPRQRLRDAQDEIALIELSSMAALHELAAERVAATTAGDRPALYAALVRLERAHWAWLLVQHQIVSDASSFLLMHRRAAAHYQRETGGSAGANSAPPQFREYLDHERRYRASAAGRAARAHWRHAGGEATEQRTRVEARVGREGTRIERVTCRLDASTSGAIRRMARAASSSLDVGIFCVFASVAVAHLQRVARAREVTLGVPFANRPTARFKNTIGSFMNVCPVRIAIEDGDTFRQVAERTQRIAWDAARHQGYATRQPRLDQPYDVLVNIHKQGVAVQEFVGLPTEVELLAPTHRFGALAISVEDFNATGMLTMSVDCNIGDFPPAARRMIVHDLLTLLAACVADPDRRPDDVGVTPSAAVAHVPRTVAAEDDVERALAEIWTELLEVGPVEPTDDFFALGGDSLLAYRMLARVRSLFAVDVSAEVFLDDPTLQGIASALRNAERRDDDA